MCANGLLQGENAVVGYVEGHLPSSGDAVPSPADGIAAANGWGGRGGGRWVIIGEWAIFRRCCGAVALRHGDENDV